MPMPLKQMIGPVLTLTDDVCDRPKVVSWLQSGNGKPNFSELMVRGVCFDEDLRSSLIELMNRNERSWECIEILNCEGYVEETMFEAISHGNNIKQLRLVNLEMGNNMFSALGKALAVNTSLSFLRLTTQLITGPDVAAFFGGFKGNKTLESLDFKWSCFDSDGVRELTRGLRENKSLKRLHLYGCSLKDEDVAGICRSLIDHPCIEEVDFSGNMCGLETSTAVAELLQSPGCFLKKLDLAGQRGPADNQLQTAPLFASLERNTSLQILDISNNRMTDSDTACLTKALCTNTTLRELYVARNKISSRGISEIATSLPQMLGLKKLSLWGNGLTETGAEEFVCALQTNRTLECLTLFREFRCSDQILHLTSLNRGGRRIFESDNPNSIPLGLWPHLLERINNLRSGKTSSIKDTRAKADAMFHLIRGPVLFDTR